jgi:signal transduction histidine kinase
MGGQRGPVRLPGTGQGLRNLRERTEGLGGRAEIDSTPGECTRVRGTIPG